MGNRPCYGKASPVRVDDEPLNGSPPDEPDDPLPSVARAHAGPHQGRPPTSHGITDGPVANKRAEEKMHVHSVEERV